MLATIKIIRDDPAPGQGQWLLRPVPERFGNWPAQLDGTELCGA